MASTWVLFISQTWRTLSAKKAAKYRWNKHVWLAPCIPRRDKEAIVIKLLVCSCFGAPFALWPGLHNRSGLNNKHGFCWPSHRCARSVLVAPAIWRRTCAYTRERSLTSAKCVAPSSHNISTWSCTAGCTARESDHIAAHCATVASSITFPSGCTVTQDVAPPIPILKVPSWGTPLRSSSDLMSVPRPKLLKRIHRRPKSMPLLRSGWSWMINPKPATLKPWTLTCWKPQDWGNGKRGPVWCALVVKEEYNEEEKGKMFKTLVPEVI